MKKLFKDSWQMNREKNQAAKENFKAYVALPGLWFLSLMALFVTGMAGMVFAALAVKAPKDFNTQITVYQNVELHREIGRKNRRGDLVVWLSIYQDGQWIISEFCERLEESLCNPESAVFERDNFDMVLPVTRLELQKWYRTEAINRIDYLVGDKEYTFTNHPIVPRKEFAFYRNSSKLFWKLSAGFGLAWLGLSILWWINGRRKITSGNS